MKDLRVLLKQLRIKPNDFSLFEKAFTHASYSNEKGTIGEDYDRLEFIGDGVLDMIVAKLIYEARPDMNSGDLTKMRASLVRGPALSKYAKDFGFNEFVRLSKGEFHNSDNKIQDRILEDVFEAFIGAYYLDFGYDAVYQLIIKVFSNDIANYDGENCFDYKSKLQILVQSDVKRQAVYEVLKESGSPQDKVFEVAVSLDGVVLGTGVGSSKKRAEQEAAKNALEKRVSDGSI